MFEIGYVDPFSKCKYFIDHGVSQLTILCVCVVDRVDTRCMHGQSLETGFPKFSVSHLQLGKSFTFKRGSNVRATATPIIFSADANEILNH